MRPVRGHPTPRPQLEGMTEPERDPEQEEQPDATEGKVIADYDPGVDYEGSEPKVEPDAQEQKEEDPDAEYPKMEMPRDSTLPQRMMPWKTYMGILWVHKA